MSASVGLEARIDQIRTAAEVTRARHAGHIARGAEPLPASWLANVTMLHTRVLLLGVLAGTVQLCEHAKASVQPLHGVTWASMLVCDRCLLEIPDAEDDEAFRCDGCSLIIPGLDLVMTSSVHGLVTLSAAFCRSCLGDR